MCTDLLADAAVEVGRAVQAAIASLPHAHRSSKAPSHLKPPPGLAALPDCVGEEAAFAVLKNLASRVGHEIRVIVDLERYLVIQTQQGSECASLGCNDTAETCSAGNGSMQQWVWTYLDAVDGTIKVAGLNNQPGHLRAANDGAWAVGVAFTHPTSKGLDCLCLSDFKVAAITDGAAAHLIPPDPLRTYPGVVLAVWCDDPSSPDHGKYVTREGGLSGPRLHTTTNTNLGQSFVYFDAFQAFDRNTRQDRDEELAVALYAQLINRHAGGAFDVLRMYGNLAALQRTMLGWQTPRSGDPSSLSTDKNKETCTNLPSVLDPSSTTGLEQHLQGHDEGHAVWLEAQCGGFLVVNENQPNLIPALPIVLGAGGVTTDFEGQPLAHRRLVDGRCNVLYAGNASLHASLLALIGRSRVAAGICTDPKLIGAPSS